jgi:glycine/serine hydroxymethyltransferase
VPPRTARLGAGHRCWEAVPCTFHRCRTWPDRPELAGSIEAEAQRQHDKLRMIPSENYVSAAVLEACGSVLNNKYSEGYAGKRYYEGQQFIDPIEDADRERGEGAVRVDHANVQPYSGSPPTSPSTWPS